MKNKKKVFALATALMMTGSAFADGYSDHEKEIGGVSYLPLRAVMEEYGYEVIWSDETKSIELRAGAGYNAYYLESNTFVRNKMAPFKLEHKILMDNGKIYVSTVDLKENMMLDELKQEDQGNQEDKIESVKISGVIIDSIDEDGRIHCLQGQSESILYLDGAKVSHYGQEGAYEITKEDIGKELLLTHPNHIAAIYPVQYRPTEVQVLDKKTSVTLGEVSGVETGEREAVLIANAEGVDVLVLIGEETVIQDLEGKELALADIKTGSKITAYHSIAMTMSIPGQTAGFKLIVEQ